MSTKTADFIADRNRVALRWDEKLTRIAFALLAALPLLALFTRRYHLGSVWDDSFMWARYADNLLHTGQIAWNPDGVHTYGLTSLLYLVVVVPIRLIFRSGIQVTMTASSLICGFVFLLLLNALVHEVCASAPAAERKIKGWLVLALWLAALSLINLQLSGMDTLFSLCYLTLFLLLCVRLRTRDTPQNRILAGFVGGLAFLIRPDVILFPLCVGAGLALRGSSVSEKRSGATLLAVTAGMLLLELAGAKLYFGTPFPLPFYAKTTHLYADFNMSQYRNRSTIELRNYLICFSPLLLLIASQAFARFRRVPRAVGAIEIGAAVAAVLHTFYFWRFVIPIMGHSMRFYFPTLPALVLLAAHGALRTTSEDAPEPDRAAAGNGARFARTFAVSGLALAALAGLGLLLAPRLRHKVFAGAQTLAPTSLPEFDVEREFLQSPSLQNRWYRLNRFSRLPDDLVIATTEVGCPAAMNPNKRIIDIAGLNTSDFALHPFSVATLLDKYHPDLFYLPDPDYRGMIRTILADARFHREYEYYPAQSRGALMGIAIRHDSRYYNPMREVMAQ